MRRFASIPYEFEPEIRLEGYGSDYDPLQYGFAADTRLIQLMRRRRYRSAGPDYVTPEDGGPIEPAPVVIDPGYDPYTPAAPADPGQDLAPSPCGCPPKANRVPWMWVALIAGAGYILGRR